MCKSNMCTILLRHILLGKLNLGELLDCKVYKGTCAAYMY